MPTKEPTGYERHKEQARARQADLSRSGRDIGRPPPIADVGRRERCRHSLRLFCETYNPRAFYLGWSPDHLSALARIEEAALHGALYAFAMPRGSGKTAICRMGALWAASYRVRRYVFIVGANAEKAQDSLKAVKTWVRFLPEYAADFPEVSHAARCLGGIANKAAGQLCQGEPTMIEWAQDRIVLPTVPPPANWPADWPLREDGMAPTSGSVVSAAGLTGDGIRGSVLTLTTGELLRPDLVLLDDPQTPESARSPAQNAQREQLIAADLLGMAGPDKGISAVMPCTVIAPGDMVDNLLDQGRHPLWRGERTRLLRSMPKNMDAWERYKEVWRACARGKPPDYGPANAYYLAHRAELDAGAVPAWPERKKDGEVSAVQHAMHLYLRDARAFWSEYQNEPLPLEPPAPGDVSAEAIVARTNNAPRGLAPAGCSRLTGFIDVQQDLLFWAVFAWGDGFTGAAVDYGAFPDQRRAHYTLRDARPTLADATGVRSLEGSLWAGLSALAALLLGRDWPAQAGGVLRVEQCLVDSGWGRSTELVKKFCRQSPYAAALLPSKGMGIGAATNPMADWPHRPGERRGDNWIVPAPKRGEGRLVLYDANAWKSFLFSRLAQPAGERGALTLYGADPEAHRLFAEHLKAESRVRTSGRGREVEEWRQHPHRPDNHLLDCAAAAASRRRCWGCTWPWPRRSRHAGGSGCPTRRCSAGRGAGREEGRGAFVRRRRGADGF
jgi:hypothetical protein